MKWGELVDYINEITLDINLRNEIPVIWTKQGDASVRSVLIHLEKDGVLYTPDSGTTIMFRCQKPDGHGVITDSATIDEETQRYLVIDNQDGTISIELIAQCSAAAGKCYCDICIIKDEKILSTIPFILDVRKSPDVANLAVSTDDFRTLSNLVDMDVPQMTVTEITGGHRISFTSVQGQQTYDVMDGSDGVSPTLGVSSIIGGHRVTITDVNGTRTVDVMDGTNGTNGTDGVDGISPVVTISSISGGNRVTITDKNGPHQVDVMNGTNGTNGTDGVDGFSPTVSVSDITGGHRVTITDKNNTRIFDIMDGDDGVSPIISVSDITGGHRVTITDITGTRTVDIMDGVKGDKGDKGDPGRGFTIAGTVATVSALPQTAEQGTFYNVGTIAPYTLYMYDTTAGWQNQGQLEGPPGEGVPVGGTAGQVLQKASATDYDTTWVDPDFAESALVVNIVYNSALRTYTSSKTLSEVLSAINDGIYVYAKYEGSVYNLSSYSQSDVFFEKITIDTGSYSSGGYTQKAIFRIYTYSGSDRVTYSYNRVSQTMPVINSDGITVYYDDTDERYRCSTANGIDDISDFFSEYGSRDMCDIILRFGSVSLDYDYDIDDTIDASAQTYHLVNRYTTHDSNNVTGHLVFQMIAIQNGQTLLKTITISDEFYQYSAMYDAIVSFSSVTIGQAPTAQGVNF